MADSSNAPAAGKPYPAFPLFCHQAGYWAKKVRGKTYYFGKLADDPKGEKALEQWQTHGIKKPGDTGPLLKDVCNRFLTAKTHQRDAGEITPRTFTEYKATCVRVVEVLDGNQPVKELTTADFERLRASFAKTRGHEALGNEIQRTRVLFKYAYDAGLIEHPMRFGPMFKRPSKKVMRMAKAKAGPKLFEVDEVRTLLAKSKLQLKAMILLALNCGFGNQDCALLPISAIDLKGGWITFPRPKTGIKRRCPLWPETIKRLKAVLATRKTPKDDAHAGLLFITKYGGSFSKATCDNPVAKEFAKVAKATGLQKNGRGFYTLRHVFRTIADETQDFPACDLIMGHGDESMAARYREKVDDARLVKVVEHVRTWLFKREAK